MLPLHCCESGTHSPVHTPAAHTYGQVVLGCHSPIASHTSTVTPLHCTSFVVHEGLHSPSTHPFAHASSGTQVPVSSQVSGVLPSHCFEPASQSTQAPSAQANSHAVFSMYPLPSLHSRIVVPSSLHFVSPAGHSASV